MHVKSLSFAAALMASVSFGPIFAEEPVPAWGEKIVAQLADLEARKAAEISAPLANEAALSSLVDSFPDLISVEIGGYTPSGQGVVAEDVTFTITGDSEIGLNIGEVRLFGLNSDFLTDISSGQTSLFAERIDLRNLSIVGLETITEQMTDAYLDAYEETLNDLSDGEGEDAIVLDFEQGIGKYELSMGQVILDGFVWHPSSEEVATGLAESTQAALSDDQDTEAAMWMVFGNLARYYRSVEIETSIISDTSFLFDMNVEVSEEDAEMKQDIKANGKIDLMTMSGVNRGDFGVMLTKGLSYSMDMLMDDPNDPDLPEGGLRIDMAGTTDLYTVEGIRFGNLFSYIERKEVPSTDVTDLMSLGVWNVYGENVTMGGETFYSIDHSMMDLSEFHWLIPEKVRFTATGLTYGVDGYLNYISSMFADVQDEEGEEIQKVIGQVSEILSDHDVDTLKMDFDVDLAWDAETGATRLHYDGRTHDFGSFILDLDFGMANFDDFAAAIKADMAYEAENGDEEDGPGSDMIAAALLQKGRLTSMNIVMDDEGGLEKLFSMAVAFAKLAPEGDEDMAFLQNNTPESIRVMASGIVRMANVQVASAFPPGVEYVNAFADFIQYGGRLEYSLKPEEPITAASQGEIMSRIAEPKTLVEYLGLGVDYQKPEAE